MAQVHRDTPATVFIRILAVATSNFGLAGVQLLIEPGRLLLILERHPLVTLTHCFRIFEIDDR